jgi:hypothetical protein
MLKLIVPGDEETFDEVTETFGTTGDVEIELEHSLVSLSKWESIYEKPFLSGERKEPREILTYIEAMVITPIYDRNVFARLSQDNITEINSYIDSKQSATTFGEMPERKGRGETITAELIYYWMVAFNIPFECEYWHLNRLFALIRICNIKNQPQKKMSRNEMVMRNRELNARRREQLGTTG